MTNEELMQLTYLRAELADCINRFRMLEEESSHATSLITGLPNAKRIGDPTAEMAVRLNELKRQISNRLLKVLDEIIRLEKGLSMVDNTLIRQALIYRYIDGNTWSLVADRLGGDHTADSVRKACNRYLQRNGKTAV
jgi:hypothetical protein